MTHSGDFFTIDRVVEGLNRRRISSFRLNTDLFPSALQLTVSADAHGAIAALTAPDGASVCLDAVQAVWLRRMAPPALPDTLDPSFVPACISESRATIDGMLGLLQAQGARIMDGSEAVATASDKIGQLYRAARHGLRTPRTLVTNDPTAVRAFHDATGGRTVAKMLTALSHAMGRAPRFVYTSAVRGEDLEALDGLQFSPMCFQEHILKDIELRVIYVGGRFFVGGIDARSSADGAVDWRRAAPDECHWIPEVLPESERAKLTALMHDFGLRYGAIDVIRTPDGEHVFLEVNPSGEWGMLEHDLGLPIGDAIAEELAG